MATTHIAKHDYRDGRELPMPISWCGKEVPRTEWIFQDAQHALLSLEHSSIEPCRDCLSAISKLIEESE